ncbi:2-dehydro-3-deoxyphosphogluconate aldolase, partial [bacterium]|nr:2-dehydro-3-deoxyphosphogluconate aldolase [bacterium]
MQVKSLFPAQTQPLEQSLQSCPVLSILRLPAPTDLGKAAESLHAGGIRVLEITLPTPGCLEAVSALRQRYPGGELRIGVGTVLSQEEASRAIGAGAEFLVTPVLDEATVQESIRHGIPILPGVFTPTEAWRAWTMGAPIVKLFPADSLSSS